MISSAMFYVKRLFLDDNGATAVEYGIIALAIGAALVPTFYFVSSAIALKFADIGSYFTG